MKTVRWLILIVTLTGFLSPTFAADVAVKGYTKKDGTVVPPYVRTAPNSTKNDNYSTIGNVNPNTGKVGTKPGDTGTPAPRTQATPAPRSVAAAPAAQSTPSSTPAPKQPSNLEPWKKLHLGMAPAEVIALVGDPNLKTAKKWVYSSVGASITFDDAGKVNGLSLPSAPVPDTTPPIATLEHVQVDGKGNTTVLSSYSVRGGIQHSPAEFNTASALLSDGWTYQMPTAKSPQAAWTNSDKRTTWFIGHWINSRTGQLSAGVPVRDGKGFRGDGAVVAGAWSTGGPPVVTKLQWLASTGGGPAASAVK